MLDTKKPLTEASRSAVFNALDALAEDIVEQLRLGNWSSARAMFNQVPERRRPYVTFQMARRRSSDFDIFDAVERLVIVHVD